VAAGAADVKRRFPPAFEFARPLASSERSTILSVAAVAPDPQIVLSELEAADRLLVQQLFKPIANEYRISVPTPGRPTRDDPCST
jgi:hypothetical protein